MGAFRSLADARLVAILAPPLPRALAAVLLLGVSVMPANDHHAARRLPEVAALLGLSADDAIARP